RLHPLTAEPQNPPTANLKSPCFVPKRAARKRAIGTRPAHGTLGILRNPSRFKEIEMARKARKKRRYSKGSQSDVKNEMRRYKKGTAKSGRGGKGGKVKSRKQAIAIGLSKARKKGKKVPRKN